MRGAILSTAVALLVCACASAPPPPIISATAAVPDYRRLTCGQLALEVARTQRAYAAAQRQMRGGEAVASYYTPISLNRAPTAQATRLSKRLEDLQRASRAKRCTSITLRSATA
ncbi:MAG: hypothetical protein Q8Q88_23280 [Phenylobacterium sp.]|uniref:hypothetical protein n=1 Tax=Phenylobacterium sp. TaxID=1871053 RepID=UPI002734640A|nr:hypothetical protein [Phenylobacterium sp.]MDP3749960.1 hypothetical protein [Phenylobacterium sp.]